MSLLVDYVLLFDQHINCLYDHTKHLYSISQNQDQPEYIHPNCYVYVKKFDANPFSINLLHFINICPTFSQY